MCTKSFFAAGLIVAAATAAEVTKKEGEFHTINAPRVSLRGPYYTSRPFF